MAFNQQDWQQPPYVGYAPPPPGQGGGFAGQPPQYPSGYPTQGSGYPAQGYPSGMGMPMQGAYSVPTAGPYPMQGGPMMGQGFPPNQGFNPQMAGGFPKPDGAGLGVTGDPNQNLGLEFSDKTIRRAFIRKVYSILMLQLLVTIAFIGLFIFNEDAKMWTRRNPSVMFIALGMMVVLLIVLTCCGSVRRKSPGNFICLGLFTLVEGFLLGIISSVHGRDEVFLAGGITCVVCLGLTLFSFQTKWDFTAMGGILFVGGIILLLFGILAMFFRPLKLAYACGGAFLFCCYLVYDTQLMLGGTHKNAISPEEYIFAALSLYLDIVNIFMYILAILSSSRGD